MSDVVVLQAPQKASETGFLQPLSETAAFWQN